MPPGTPKKGNTTKPAMVLCFWALSSPTKLKLFHRSASDSTDVFENNEPCISMVEERFLGSLHSFSRAAPWESYRDDSGEEFSLGADFPGCNDQKRLPNQNWQN